jgi:hypothetical protein
MRLGPGEAPLHSRHGRLLSLPRLSPHLQPAVRRQARQPVPQARPRSDRTQDGRLPAGLGPERASVLEIGGGTGENQIELLQAGAARAQNLELSPPTRNRHTSWPPRPASKGASTGVSTTSPRIPGRWRRPTWWSCTGWCAATGLCAPAGRGRRPCPTRPGLQLSTPGTCSPRGFYAVFNLAMRLTRSSFAVSPTRRPRCLRCWGTTGFGGCSSVAVGSGRSLAWSAFLRRGAAQMDPSPDCVRLGATPFPGSSWQPETSRSICQILARILISIARQPMLIAASRCHLIQML